MNWLKAHISKKMASAWAGAVIGIAGFYFHIPTAVTLPILALLGAHVATQGAVDAVQAHADGNVAIAQATSEVIQHVGGPYKPYQQNPEQPVPHAPGVK